MKIVLLLIVVAVIVCGVLFARVYRENRRSIDCGMHATSVAIVALHRDKGETREQVRAMMDSPNFGAYSAAHTPAQIETMLDAVFVHGVGKSVEEIRNLAYQQCDQGSGP
jgi:hypothetical protein